jgi:FlaG/FlaF family flagellin (archaellin)
LNYHNTFITISDDCPQKTGTVPTTNRAKRTVQMIQYELLAGHPYEFNQEDVLFMTYVAQK